MNHWCTAEQAADEAKCIDKGKLYLVPVVVHVATDLIIILLPVPVISPLQMPLRRKVLLCLLFATGGLYVHSLCDSHVHQCLFVRPTLC